MTANQANQEWWARMRARCAEIRATAEVRALQLGVTVQANPTSYWGAVFSSGGSYICPEETLGKEDLPLLEKAVAEAKAKDEAAAAYAATLSAIPGVATLRKERTWGPGPRAFAEITVGEWTLRQQLSGLPADYTGVSGPSKDRATVEQVRRALFHRLDDAIQKMEVEIEMPDLNMIRGDARDRFMGWDSWPSGPESVSNSTTIPA